MYVFVAGDYESFSDSSKIIDEDFIVNIQSIWSVSH